MVKEIWLSSDSNIRWACIELLNFNIITHIDAIEKAGFHRLSQTIYLLRHKYEWPIETERMHSRGIPNLAHYKLKKGTDISKLKKPPSYYKGKKALQTPSNPIKYKTA